MKKKTHKINGCWNIVLIICYSAPDVKEDGVFVSSDLGTHFIVKPVSFTRKAVTCSNYLLKWRHLNFTKFCYMAHKSVGGLRRGEHGA